MVIAQRQLGRISLLLVLCLLLAPFIEAAELSLFEKLKQKTQTRVEELQQRDWWITKAASTAAGFVAGKAGGALGAAVGYVLGAAVGGPVAAGMGAMLGFRIGDIVTKTFARAIGALVTQWKLHHGRKVDMGAVLDAVKTVNKASLTADAAGAVIGDLIGGTLGAAAGIAFLSCGGPIMLPIIGTISAAYIGSKIGKAIGGGIGRWIGRKVLKKGYEAYAAMGNSKEEDERLEEGLVKIEGPADPAESRVPDEKMSDSALDARTAYEKAYRDYTDTVTSTSATNAEKQASLQAYRAAYDAYQSALSAAR